MPTNTLYSERILLNSLQGMNRFNQGPAANQYLDSNTSFIVNQQSEYESVYSSQKDNELPQLDTLKNE